MRAMARGSVMVAPGIVPLATFVHPCTAHMGGAVGVGVLELVDDEAVAVDAQALEGDWGPQEISAHALELLSLLGPARHGGVEREAVARDGEGLWRGLDNTIVGSCNVMVLALRPRGRRRYGSARRRR